MQCVDVPSRVWHVPCRAWTGLHVATKPYRVALGVVAESRVGLDKHFYVDIEACTRHRASVAGMLTWYNALQHTIPSYSTEARACKSVLQLPGIWSSGSFVHRREVESWRHTTGALFSYSLRPSQLLRAIQHRRVPSGGYPKKASPAASPVSRFVIPV